MGLKSLACVLLIFLSFPILILSLGSPLNSTYSHSKQTTLLHGHDGATQAYNTKHPSPDTTYTRSFDKDVYNKKIHAYIKKGHGKGGGANSAGHHTPDPNKKNDASALLRPSSLISPKAPMLPCFIVFAFIFFPL